MYWFYSCALPLFTSTSCNVRTYWLFLSYSSVHTWHWWRSGVSFFSVDLPPVKSIPAGCLSTFIVISLPHTPISFFLRALRRKRKRFPFTKIPELRTCPRTNSPSIGQAWFSVVKRWTSFFLLLQWSSNYLAIVLVPSLKHWCSILLLKVVKLFALLLNLVSLGVPLPLSLH